MTWSLRDCSHWMSIALLTGALVISGETTLFASPQSAESGTASQAPAGTIPDAPQVQPATQDQQQAPVPSGTAAAKAATVKGSPVAKPAGAAVAPVRQRGHRSLIIKLGLLAGAGIAVGTAVALSAGSPSRPPGTASSAR